MRQRQTFVFNYSNVHTTLTLMNYPCEPRNSRAHICGSRFFLLLSKSTTCKEAELLLSLLLGARFSEMKIYASVDF